MNDKICPICGSDTEHKSYYLDDWCLEEEYISCTACKRYFYEYSYGAHRYTIGGHEIIYSYTEYETKRVKKLHQVVARCIQIEKRKFTMRKQ